MFESLESAGLHLKSSRVVCLSRHGLISGFTHLSFWVISHLAAILLWAQEVEAASQSLPPSIGHLKIVSQWLQSSTAPPFVPSEGL